jgi:hypothetical protein
MSIMTSGVMKLIPIDAYEFIIMSAFSVGLGYKNDSWFQFADSKFNITDFLCNSLCTVPMAHCEGCIVLFVVDVC